MKISGLDFQASIAWLIQSTATETNFAEQIAQTSFCWPAVVVLLSRT